MPESMTVASNAMSNDDAIALDTMRHSCAHLLAAAIQSLHSKARFGVGPVIANGFFYDIHLPESIHEDDLKAIDKTMQKMRKKKIPFERIEMPIDDAIALMEKQKQPYKVELLRLLKEKGSTAVAEEMEDSNIASGDGQQGVDTVSIYKLGDFVDLCRGPHVEHSGQVGAFKLLKLAGAYWRGDAKNEMLQRVYGLCYATKDEVQAELHRIEEAKRRDHRRIGKTLSLFTFSDEVGLGLPLWLPKGVALRKELEFLAQEQELRDGYQFVVTPHIGKEALYYKSGHLPYYVDDMYEAIDIDGDRYRLRPMNCPHHHAIYSAQPYSYRDLPVRLSEYGQVYRYELSGALNGLMRTRGFCQNDAHVYVAQEDAQAEFLRVMQLHARYYDMFDIEDYYMLLALPDMNDLAKYVDQPEEWLKALEIIRSAMKESGYPFVEAGGEAAFYGPKVDFMIKNAIGTEYAISTNQLDFLATQRFDLTYRGNDGNQHPVYVIHRAPLGSHERFVAFLTEHYVGRFPTWLAPVQVCIIPISDSHVAYAKQIEQALRAVPVRNGTGGIRVVLDNSSERMQKKIRNAQLEQVPYMLVIGDSEMEAKQVAVRLRSGDDLGAMPLEKLIERITQEIHNRKDLTNE